SHDLVTARWSQGGDGVYILTTGPPKLLERIPIDPVSGTTTGTAAIVQSGVEATSFAVRPDDSVVVTRSSVDGRVWRIERGGQPVRLSEGTDSHVAVAISPDGKQVALVRAPGELRVMALAGGAARKIDLPGKRLGQPAWSPDGSELAVLDLDGALWAVPSAGGAARLITKVPAVAS